VVRGVFPRCFLVVFLMADPTHLPNWRDVALRPGVLRESALDDSSLVLWLPVERDRSCQHWQRISTAPHADVGEHNGLVSIAATMIVARQPFRSTFRTLLHRFRRSSEARTWQLPNGEEAEQEGTRRMDVMLVWAIDNQLLDKARIQGQWPQCSRVELLGPRLFLVCGVASSPVQSRADSPSPELPSPRQAEERLAQARRNGDKVQVASLLADLGLLAFDEGNDPIATARLEESLALVRSLGDQAREGDVLGILGLVAFKAGRLDEARRHLEQALALVRAVGDRFTEKLTLERLATVQALHGELPTALSLLADALTLARTLGDRQHEANLLWHLAILQVESGQRGQAIDCGQQAIELLRTLGQPQTRVYAEHLQQYRDAEADGSSLGKLSGQNLPGSPLPPKHAGPSYLRMAVSAASALVQFVGSGLKTVPAETLEERMRRCGDCSHYTGMRCRVCGCFASLKARLPHEDCPLGQWPKG
jgi:tetratricopeptide (TPR) repeat protein